MHEDHTQCSVQPGPSQPASSLHEIMQDGGDTAEAGAIQQSGAAGTILGSALAGAGSRSRVKPPGTPQQQQQADKGSSRGRDATAAALAAVGVQLGPPTALERRAAGAPAADLAAAPSGASVHDTHTNGHGPQAATASALDAAQRALAAKEVALKPPTSGKCLQREHITITGPCGPARTLTRCPFRTSCKCTFHCGGLAYL